MSGSKATFILNLFLIKEQFKDDENIIKKDLSSLKKIEVVYSNTHIGNLYIKPTFYNKPHWSNLFSEVNIPELDDLNISSASAVLLVRNEGRIFALVFGYGGYLLNRAATEERFGLKTTLNSIVPDSIRSIDRKIVDSLARHVREDVNRDTSFRNFGVDVEQDLLNAITGKSSLESLGTRLTGKDNFVSSVKISLSDLIPFISTAYSQYQKKDYQDSFGWVDNIKDIVDPAIIEKLNFLLIEEVKKGHQTDKLWLAVPDLVPWARVLGFRFSKSNRHEIKPDLHINDFYNSLQQPDQLKTETLKQKTAYCYDVEKEQPFFEWSVYRCICFEVELEDNTYILNDGKWYRINPEFVSNVDDYISKINASSLHLPEYTHHKSEKEYNKAVSKKDPNIYAFMDSKLIKYGGGYSSLEFCDVFTKEGQIIHVKKYGGSSVLSHLFSQGAVSAELFLLDGGFRKEVNKILPETHKHLVQVEQPDPRKYEIAFCIISRSKNKLKLPFFSRINLRTWARRLNGFGFNVTLTKIFQEEY